MLRWRVRRRYVERPASGIGAPYPGLCHSQNSSSMYATTKTLSCTSKIHGNLPVSLARISKIEERCTSRTVIVFLRSIVRDRIPCRFRDSRFWHETRHSFSHTYSSVEISFYILFFTSLCFREAYYIGRCF